MILDLQPGLHHGVSEKDYHADNLCVRPTLSCSLAKVLINTSPLHAWCEHPRLGNKRNNDPTPEQEFGLAAHKLALGKGADIAVFDGDSWRGKEAGAFRDNARDVGQIPILAEKLVKAEAQRAALREQLDRFGMLGDFDAATPEVVVIHDDGAVRCRAMLDKLFINEATKRATIFDLKTTESANPRGLGRLVFNQHYDMQERSYVAGVERNRPDLAGRIDFRFFFIETEYPFCLTPYRLSGEQQTLGVSKWTRAWQMWDACLKADAWPAYTTQLVVGEAPAYALNAEMGANPILPPPAPQDLSEGAKHAANSEESRARETVST